MEVEKKEMQPEKMSRFPELHRAIRWAVTQHSGQDRSYSGVPYICHPLAVMEIVRTVTDDEAMLCAAVLHDVVEDTSAMDIHVRENFGDDVADIVHWLTDKSRPEDGNRKTRKDADRAHTAEATPRAKTVKLADLIHNMGSITKEDPNFAVVFVKEAELLLNVLAEGHPALHSQLYEMIQDYQSNLVQEAIR